MATALAGPDDQESSSTLNMDYSAFRAREKTKLYNRTQIITEMMARANPQYPDILQVEMRQ